MRKVNRLSEKVIRNISKPILSRVLACGKFITFMCLFFLFSSMVVTAETYVPVDVQKGTNLNHLARDFCTSRDTWKDIATINNLKAPYTIYEDTTLLLPLSKLITENIGAEVISVHGDVFRVNNDGDKATIKKGDRLFTGDIVESGEKSFAHLLLPDQKHTRIAPNSTFKINYLFRLTDKSMKADFTLSNGRIIHAIKKRLNKGDSFKTRTPVSITGIRGTEFRIKMIDETTNYIETISGEVEVASGDNSVVLRSGEGSKISGSDLMPVVEKLPEPPSLPELQSVYKKLPVSFLAPAHPDAEYIRLRMCTDEEGNDTFYESTVQPGEKIVIVSLEDGEYYTVVTAIGANDFESKPAKPFLVKLRTIPSAPIISEPQNSVVTFDTEMGVGWLRADHVKSYKYQLSSEETFSTLIQEDVVEDNEMIFTDLMPGSYFFRVLAIAEDQFESLYSMSVAWKLSKAPNLGGDNFKADKDGGYQWAPMDEEGTYDLQIAKDADFKEIVISEDGLIQPQYKITRHMKAGDYYLRIRGVLTDGQASPWSAPQILTIEQPSFGVVGIVSLLTILLVILI